MTAQAASAAAPGPGPSGHDLEAAGARGLQRFGQQAGLADPGLALDDHDGRPSPRRPAEGVDERP
jgi:hypothetical protein